MPTTRKLTSRTFLAGLIGFALALVPLSTASAAVAPVSGWACAAKNMDTATLFTSSDGSALTNAINAASSNQRIQIRGICVGNYIISSTNLKLIGAPTAAHPIPTINGGNTGTALYVALADVTVQRLTITNGKFFFCGCGGGGGGIHSYISNVTLNDTDVTGNYSEMPGGGILNEFGTLTLKKGSSVTNNVSEFFGGGIDNWQSGTVVVTDSLISGNSAPSGNGGGIHSFTGSVTLNGTASVSGNSALGAGGGVAVSSATFRMNGASTVTGNAATSFGGGVYGDCSTLINTVPGGNVHGNAPNDVTDAC